MPLLLSLSSLQQDFDGYNSQVQIYYEVESMETHQEKNSESEPNFSSSGVDLTLIRWSLSLSPLERLLHLQNHVHSVLKIRNANPKL